MNGNYEGGGVCINCQDNTAGINCEQCKAGYYRPADKAKTDRDACKGMAVNYYKTDPPPSSG